VFGLLLDFLLLASLVWVELVSGPVLWLGWTAAGVIWLASLLRTARSGGLRNSPQAAAARDDLFRHALGEYLKGAWFEAESALGELIAADNRDADARLMLASLLRHTRRVLEARRQLDELQRLEKAEKWRLEIDRERQLLKLAEAAIFSPPAEEQPVVADVARAA
jgi:thioredoxin-like negative regulator of GroEL